MRFPSLKSLADNVTAAIKRFPFEVLFALAGTIASTIYINSGNYLNDWWFSRAIMTANLGLLLSLATTLFTESKGFMPGRKFVFKLVMTIFAGCLFFVINPDVREMDYFRFALLCIAFHLLVSFAAFTEKGHVHGFWQFNKTLFLRFLAAVLYSGVLYLGLCAAITASKLLFNLNFTDKVYGILFTWIAGIFNTVFFLAGVPEDTQQLDNDTTYPKGLKVFTQYVLIPLASVYVIILLAYEVKILINWNLPKGYVSNLILGYAVFGILSILLVYPLRNQEGNKWIKTYARSFYFLLVPLLALLFLAIGSRVMPYGITAPRYFLIILAVWLLLLTAYFLSSKKQNIKLIPISLCILTLLSAYGPQSAFSVSAFSQRRILTGVFKKYGAFGNGKLSPLHKIKMSRKDGDNAVEKLDYLIDNDDINALQPCIGRNLEKVLDSIKKANNAVHAARGYSALSERYALRDKEKDWAIKYLGLNAFSTNSSNVSVIYEFEAKNKQFLSITGYDYLVDFSNADIYSDTVVLKEGNIRVSTTASTSQVYTLHLNNESVLFDTKAIASSLVKSADKLKAYKTSSAYNMTYVLPKQLLGVTKQTAHFKVTFQIDQVSCNYGDSDDLDVYAIGGHYFISVLK